jgi:hypothetical protein
MDFIDDVYFVPSLRRVLDTFAQRLYFSYSAVRCAVYFKNIGAVALGNRSTAVACAAWCGCGRVETLAIKAFRENTRSSSFAGASRPAEKVSVCKPVLFDGVYQGVRYMLLCDYFVEGLRPEFSCQNEIRHIPPIGWQQYNILSAKFNPNDESNVKTYNYT